MKNSTTWAQPCLEAMEKANHAQHTQNNLVYLMHGYRRNAAADRQNKNTSLINMNKGGVQNGK